MTGRWASRRAVSCPAAGAGAPHTAAPWHWPGPLHLPPVLPSLNAAPATPNPAPPLPPAVFPLQLLRGTERYVETLSIQVLPGCSHWVQQDQPEEVNRRMREFLPPRSKQ